MNDQNHVGAVGMAPEEAMPSLADIAQEPGGAWPKGWYQAEIIQGYRAGQYMFETEDKVSKAGNSRNLRLSLKMTAMGDKTDPEGNSVAKGASRNTFVSYNYRLDDLTAANVARVKENEADTRLKIALGRLGAIEKAVGMPFKRHPQGFINVTPLIGQKMDVRLGFDDKGFNEVTAVAKLGTKAR